MSTHRRKALILTYLFPPIGGIGVQRPLKFVKYLRDFGFEPVVLTTAKPYYPTMDETLLGQIPDGVKVTRVADPISRWIGKVVTSTSAKGSATGEASTNLITRGAKVRSILKRIKNFVCVPDEQVFWSLRAAVTAMRMVREEKIDCLYTTSGPNSTHIAGWLIRRFTGVKWVADFRDPWTDNLHYKRTGIRARFERTVEHLVFQKADAITVVTEGFKDLFATKYPQYRDKIRVLRNGVDLSDFPEGVLVSESSKRRRGPFTFFYAGILYDKRSPEAFLQALSSLLRYGQLQSHEVSVQFAGVFDYPGQNANRDLVQALGLTDVVKTLGYLPHHEVLRRQTAADALLLIGEKSKSAGSYVPGKLYEYLYARRPILGILEDGEAADLIRRANAGSVISPSMTKLIADEILNLVKRRTEFTVSPDEEFLGTFSRRGQTRELAELMHSLTNVFGTTAKEQIQEIQADFTL